MGQSREITPIQRINRSTDRVQIESGIIPEKLIHGVIGVDLEALLDLMNLGGFETLNISNESSEENGLPQIVGVDAQGVAMAGKAKNSTTPLFSGRTEDRINLNISPFFLGSNTAWSKLDIDVDTQEFKQWLIERRQLRDAEAWADRLDKEVKNLLLIKGLANLFYFENDELLSAFSSTIMLASFLYVLSNVVFITHSVDKILHLFEATLILSIYSIIYYFNNFRHTQHYNQINGENLPTRFSLFPSLEIERALALVIKSKIRRVFVGKNIN